MTAARTIGAVSVVAPDREQSATSHSLTLHHPLRVREAAELNIPLVLSGHTHGGQIVLPGIGAWNRGFFPTMHGTLEKDNTVLFVSRGVGMVYLPVRINCPPEVALLTLARRGEFSA